MKSPDETKEQLNAFQIKKMVMRMCAIAMVDDDKIGFREFYTIAQRLIAIIEGSKNNDLKHYLDDEDFYSYIDNGSKSWEIMEGGTLLHMTAVKLEELLTDNDTEKKFSLTISENVSEDKYKNSPIPKSGLTAKNLCAWLYTEYCYSTLRDSQELKKSIYMNFPSLGNKQKVQEIRNTIEIIAADGITTDREREAFRIICKMLRIRNSTLLWNSLINKETADYEKIIEDKIEYNNQTSFYDIKYITNSLTDYNIKGPMGYGVSNVIQQEVSLREHKIHKTDKFMNKVAFIAFAISSFMLYLGVQHAHNTHADSHGAPLKTIVMTSAAAEKSETDTTTNCIPLGITIVNGLENVFFARKAVLENKEDTVPSMIKNWICIFLLSILLVFTIILNFRKIVTWLKNAYDIWMAKPLSNLNKAHRYRRNTFIVLAVMLFFTDLIMRGKLHIANLIVPICLLIIMISIEWLIFMREQHFEKSSKNHENGSPKKQNNGLLVVIVIAAIISDICLGLIELGHFKDNSDQILVKIMSAIFLGCLCFFFGKFLENYRAQQRQEINDMLKYKDEVKKHTDKMIKEKS